MSVSECFLIGMLIIFGVPFLTWRIFRTDYFAPLVVVQIVIGVLLGPGVLGSIYPAFYHTIFTAPVIQALNGLAWWGVMLFVFLAGIELNVKEAWEDRFETVITAGLALGTPLLLGCAAAAVILSSGKISEMHTNDWIGVRGAPWQFVFGTGMMCAVTALPILVLFMEKLSILRSSLGQRVLRYASLDDIAIWSVLALILLDWDRVERQCGFLLGYIFAAIAMRWIMHRISKRDRWYTALIWLAACAFAADWCGLHFMVGAFLAGVAIDGGAIDREELDTFRNYVLQTLMPVFFLSTGLRTNWEMGGFAVISAAVLLLLASVAGKLLGIEIAARILKWPKGEAAIIGWLLQTKALIMIIFATVLLDKEIITEQTFTSSLLMAIASTMLTIPMVSRLMSERCTVLSSEASQP